MMRSASPSFWVRSTMPSSRNRLMGSILPYGAGGRVRTGVIVGDHTGSPPAFSMAPFEPGHVDRATECAPSVVGGSEEGG